VGFALRELPHTFVVEILHEAQFMKRFAFALVVLVCAVSVARADLPPPPPPPPPHQEAANPAPALAAMAIVVGVMLLGVWLSRRSRNSLEPQG